MAARRATRRRCALVMLVLFLLPVLVFARVVGFGFVQDDTHEIVRNDSLRAPLAQTLGAVVRATAHAQGIPNATRPVAIASLTLDHRLFGLEPRGYHAHSLLLHALVSAIAGACAFALTRRTRVALVAGLVFALAPLHAEVIAGISNRDELIAALGLLATLCLVAWPRAGPLPLGAEIGVAAIWLIALGARESALALPLLLLASWAILRPPHADLRQRESLVFTLIGMLIVWINWRFAVQLSGDGIPRVLARDSFAIACDTARFEVRAVLQALLPLRSTVDYTGDRPAGPAWLLALFGLAVLVFALARARATRTPALGIAFALLAPLPASPLFGPITPRADRYLYLAVLGGALVWGWAADRLACRLPRRLSQAALVLAVAALIVACQLAISPWANEQALEKRLLSPALPCENQAMLGGLADKCRAFVARGLRGLRARAGMARPPASPHTVNWDLTYACPLKCGHCYSESGRRSARQLPLDDLLRVADVLLEIEPHPTVAFSGGEPILVKGMLELAGKLKRGGARLVLYTSGYRLTPALAAGIAATFDRISVSIDGADAPTNDFLRERRGAFDEAARALSLLDDAMTDRRARPGSRGELAIEVTVMNSNFYQLERFCTELAPRFPELDTLRFGALIPTGFASRESFVERELLSEAQMAELALRARRLQKLAPRGVRVRVFSNLPFLLHPAQIRRGIALDGILKIEADGRVRGMDIYEGTVGRILEEPFEDLWRKSLERHRDRFVVEQLCRVHTMNDWAKACRAIDLHFAAPEDKARIVARPLAAELPPALRVRSEVHESKRRKLDLFQL